MRPPRAHVPADPTAPAVGRIVALPDGDRAVIIGQSAERDTWHGQRLTTGAFVAIVGTRPNRATGARPFPVVGHYADAAAMDAPTLPLAELERPACAACLTPYAEHDAPHIRHPYTWRVAA